MTPGRQERRKFQRVERGQPAPGNLAESHGERLLVNASAGGVCLWLRDPPAMEQACALTLRWEGRLQVLLVRPVWLREHLVNGGREKRYRQDGWLAGFAFTPPDPHPASDTLFWNIPQCSEIAVEFPGECRASVPPERGQGAERESIIDEKTAGHLKGVVESLVPVLSRHFAEMSLVVMPERVEMSARFRSPAELSGLRAPESGPRAIRAALATPPPSATEIDPPAGPGPLAGWRAVPLRRLALLAGAGLLAAAIGWKVLGLAFRAAQPATVSKASFPQSALPPWAEDLTAASRDKWVQAQVRFGVPDSVMTAMIRILRANDRYPPHHWLYDLSAYPIQAERALTILAMSGPGTPPDLGALTRDLEMKMVAGARFPDESPGERHLAMTQESFDNSTVLAIIDLLARKRDDPAVKGLLAALRRPRR